MATVKKTMKKSAPKKAMMKKAPAKSMPAMQAPPMQPSVGGPGAMGGGPMMKKGGKVKKAQDGRTVMQKLKAKYPDTDTTAAGDTRFREFNAYAPKKELNKIAEIDKAFNTKYGKDKPAVDKSPKKKTPNQKKGGVTKKSMKMGGKMTTKYKMGGKMSKKK